jgi:anti-anti-sigma regulatory factor
MPTQITQVEDTDRNKMILRVEGEMLLDDALLLEKIALQMRDEIGRNITLDLADLDLLDSESAPILKRMERQHKFEIEGVEFFLQKVVDDTEKVENTNGK